MSRPERHIDEVTTMFCSLSRIDLPSTFSSKTSRYDSVELEAAAGDIAVCVLWRARLERFRQNFCVWLARSERAVLEIVAPKRQAERHLNAGKKCESGLPLRTAQPASHSWCAPSRAWQPEKSLPC